MAWLHSRKSEVTLTNEAKPGLFEPATQIANIRMILDENEMKIPQRPLHSRTRHKLSMSTSNFFVDRQLTTPKDVGSLASKPISRQTRQQGFNESMIHQTTTSQAGDGIDYAYRHHREINQAIAPNRRLFYTEKLYQKAFWIKKLNECLSHSLLKGTAKVTSPNSRQEQKFHDRILPRIEKLHSPKDSTTSVLNGLKNGEMQAPTTLTIKSIKPKTLEIGGKQLGNSRIGGVNAIQKITASPNVSRFSIRSEQESLLK